MHKENGGLNTSLEALSIDLFVSGGERECAICSLMVIVRVGTLKWPCSGLRIHGGILHPRPPKFRASMSSALLTRELVRQRGAI